MILCLPIGCLLITAGAGPRVDRVSLVVVEVLVVVVVGAKKNSVC